MFILAICSMHSVALGQTQPTDELHPLKPLDAWSCVLANQTTTFCYALEGAREQHIALQWTLISGERVLSRGQDNSRIKMVEGGPQFTVQVPMPSMKPGVIVDNVTLKLSLLLDGQEQTAQRKLTIYSKNAFSQQNILNQVKLKLYDPKGSTAELLNENDIPHTRLLNLAAIDLVTEGILLVGEGVSLRTERRLPSSLYTAAGRGVSVLCLAPTDGHFSIESDFSTKKFLPRQMIYGREDWIQRFDKRFDTVDWPEGRSLSSSLKLQPIRGHVVLQIDDQPTGWAWVEMQFPAEQPQASEGTLMVCGLGIVKHWESSPVPRHLFTHLLSDLTHNANPKELNDASMH